MGELVGSTERTTTDKKRERRRKKALQRQRKMATEDKAKRLKSAGIGETKESAMKSVEKISKSDKGITVIRVRVMIITR